MRYELFFIPFLSSFIIAIIFLIFLVFLNKKNKIKNPRESERHIHSREVSRLGGLAIILSFLIVVFFDKRLVIETPLLGVIIASFAILIFGIIDDFKELSWKNQLLFQFFIATFIYFMGVRLEYVSNPLGGIFLFHGTIGQIISFLIAVVWIIFIINAVNWVDGIDGSSSGIAIIGALTIFFLSLRPEVNQPPIGIITAALVGSLMAFLFFNFYPAKILAGTSGSMFMGFILAILAIFAGAKIATTLMVLIIPAVDALWVIYERYRFKKSIFSPDRRHLHFRLMKIGWSQRKICFFYYTITIFVAVLALNTRAFGKTTTLLIFAIVIMFISFIIRNRLEKQKVYGVKNKNEKNI